MTMLRKGQSGARTMPDNDRRPAQVLASALLPEAAPIAKRASPILDPMNPIMVTLVSPIRGTKSRVPRKAYTLHVTVSITTLGTTSKTLNRKP